MTTAPPLARARRVLLLGATGTIGRATAHALVAHGQDVVCVTRSAANGLPDAATVRIGDVTDSIWLEKEVMSGDRFDAVISCLASRSGTPKDAWAIDHRANLDALHAAQAAGIPHVILLSAICVQKPLLAFQHAKLAFEQALIESGLRWSIVRPTAFFKSLSGQVERVRKGKPFLVFGKGDLTACKPISNADLGEFIAGCIDDPSRWNRILPIGGPGPAITPRDQADALFTLLGQPPRLKHVPVRLLDTIIAIFGSLGRVSPALAAKADLARIGRYYATESMLVLDPATGRYDPAATPETGSDTLFDYYAQLIAGEAQAERGEHAVF